MFDFIDVRQIRQREIMPQVLAEALAAPQDPLIST
jgi:hypothetical protein